MIEEVCCLFNMAQAIGVEMVEWIAEAKKRCGLLGRSHSWNWNGEERLDTDCFPLWKDSYLFWTAHSNLAILMPLYYTHIIRIKPELRLPLYSRRQLNFPNRWPTLL